MSQHGRVNWTLLDGTEVSEIAQKSGKIDIGCHGEVLYNINVGEN